MTLMNIVYAADGITNKALGSGVPKDSNLGLAFYIAQLWKTVVIVGGLAFLVYLIWGGLQWVTSGGDKTKLDDAQHKIYNSMVGLGILVASYAFVRLVGGVLEINLLQPSFEKNY
jgi:hypothetical protein